MHVFYFPPLKHYLILLLLLLSYLFDPDMFDAALVCVTISHWASLNPISSPMIVPSFSHVACPSTLKTQQAASPSYALLMFYQTMWCHIPESSNLCIHCCENLRPRVFISGHQVWSLLMCGLWISSNQTMRIRLIRPASSCCNWPALSTWWVKCVSSLNEPVS
jgi:hypothetical protein